MQTYPRGAPVVRGPQVLPPATRLRKGAALNSDKRPRDGHDWTRQLADATCFTAGTPTFDDTQ